MIMVLLLQKELLSNSFEYSSEIKREAAKIGSLSFIVLMRSILMNYYKEFS